MDKRDVGSGLPSILYFPSQRFLSPVSGKMVRREPTPNDFVFRYTNASAYEGSLDSYLIWMDYAEPEAFLEVQGFLENIFDGQKKFRVNRKLLKAVVEATGGVTHDVDQLRAYPNRL